MEKQSRRSIIRKALSKGITNVDKLVALVLKQHPKAKEAAVRSQAYVNRWDMAKQAKKASKKSKSKS